MSAVRRAGVVCGPRQASRVVLEPVPEHRCSNPSRGPRGGRSDPNDRRTQGTEAAPRAHTDEGGTGRIGDLASGPFVASDPGSLGRLERRRLAGELDSEVWDDITAMLDQFIPGHSPRPTPPVPAPPAASQPASATTLPELIQALDRLSAGLETGRIYDRDVVTLGPALDRLGNAWVRRTSR